MLMCNVTGAEKRQLLNTNTILFKERQITPEKILASFKELYTRYRNGNSGKFFSIVCNKKIF